MLLSIVIFLPLLGVIAIALLRGMEARVVKTTALIVALLTFVVSLGLYWGFEADSVDAYGFQNNDQLHQEYRMD